MKWEDMLESCSFDDDVFENSKGMDYFTRQRILERTLKKIGKSKWRRLIARYSARTACAVCLLIICSVTVVAATVMNTDFEKYWESGDTTLVPVRNLNLNQKLGDYEITLKQMAGDSFGVLLLIEVTGDDAGKLESICKKIDWEIENDDRGGGIGYKKVDNGNVSDKNAFVFYFNGISNDIRGKNMKLTFCDIVGADGSIIQPGMVTFDLTLDYDIVQIEKNVNREIPFKDSKYLLLEKYTVSSIGLCLEMSGEITEDDGGKFWEDFCYEILFKDGTKLTERERIGGGAITPGSDTVDGDVDLNYKFSKIIDPREIVSIKVNGSEVYQ